MGGWPLSTMTVDPQGYEVHIIVDGVSSQRLGDRAVALQVACAPLRLTVCCAKC